MIVRSGRVVPAPDPNALGETVVYPFTGTQWTSVIPANPTLAPNSAGLVTNFNKQWATQPGWGVPPQAGPSRFIVHGNSIAWTNMDVNPGHRWTSYNPSGTISVPLPPNFQPGGGTDAEVTVYDVDNNHIYDFWVVGPQNTDGSWTCNTMCDAVLTNFPGVYSPTPTTWGGSSLGSSCSASRFPYGAGMITLADVLSGGINHAISITIGSAGAWVPPANQNDGTLNNTVDTEYSTVPEGTRFFFPPAVPIPAGLDPFAEMVFVAIQTYGAFIFDETAGNGLNIPVENFSLWSAWAGGQGPQWSWVSGIGDTYTGRGVLPWPIMQNLANLLPWSQLQAYTPKIGWKGTEPGVPTVPQSVTAASGGSAGTITVSWAAPSSDGGSAITGYNVYMGTATTAEWPMPVNATGGAVASGSTSVASTATSLALTGLTTGTTYYFVVAAVTANGVGAGATEVSFTAP